MPSEDSDYFTSFPLWIPFIASSGLIAMTKTSKIMLNKSGENGNRCLIPDFRRTAFSFSQWSMMLAASFSYMVFVKNYVSSSYAHFTERFFFNHK